MLAMRLAAHEEGTWTLPKELIPTINEGICCSYVRLDQAAFWHILLSSLIYYNSCGDAIFTSYDNLLGL